MQGAPSGLPDASEHGGAASWLGVDIVDVGQAGDGAEARPRRPRSGHAVNAALREIRDAGTLVEGEELDAALAVLLERAEQDLAPLAVLHDVGCGLRGDHGDPTQRRLVEAELLCHSGRGATGLAGLRRVHRGNHGRLDHDVHRAMVTFVPSPGRDSMAYSLESRRAPPSPGPRPFPVV